MATKCPVPFLVGLAATDGAHARVGKGLVLDIEGDQVGAPERAGHADQEQTRSRLLCRSVEVCANASPPSRADPGEALSLSCAGCRASPISRRCGRSVLVQMFATSGRCPKMRTRLLANC